MIKLAIVEDTMADQKLFKKHVKTYCEINGQEVEIIGFLSGEEFLNSPTDEFDAVFMDIEMPGINGIETAKELRKNNDKIIIVFITNVVNYAIEGYSVEALDFILKPVEYFRISRELDKIIKRVKMNSHDCIMIKNDDGMHRIDINDIVYIETVGRKLMLHTFNDSIVFHDTLNSIESRLDPDMFYRNHISYIVNLNHINSIAGNDIKIKDSMIPVSRHKKKGLCEAFAKSIGNRL